MILSLVLGVQHIGLWNIFEKINEIVKLWSRKTNYIALTVVVLS